MESKKKLVWYIGEDKLVLTKTGDKKRTETERAIVDQPVSSHNSKPNLPAPENEELIHSILSCLGLVRH